MRVAVIGAGIMGSCAALHLAERGHDVDWFDRYPLGHDQGSSHGRSRIVRIAYPDPFYARAMVEGYPMWRELERRLGQTVLHECGLLYLGKSDAPNVEGVRTGLRELQIPFEERTSGQPAPLDGEVGIFSQDGGWVAADLALRGIQELAQAAGARFTQATISPSDLRHDRIVVAAGGWVRELADIPVTPTVQTFAYFWGRVEGPVWIEDGPDGIYGFPSEPGKTTFKVGFHRGTRGLVPAQSDRSPDPAQIQAIQATIRRRFDLGAEVVEAKTCIYTTTANDDFIVDWLDPRFLVVSPCSGHGFKFGPWIGRHVADLVEDKASPIDRFRLS